MNGVPTTTWRRGLPATTVIQLAGSRPLPLRSVGNAAGDAALLAAAVHPPRTGETRPLASLMPDVLASYGLTQNSRAAEANLTVPSSRGTLPPAAIDTFA